MLKWLVQRVSEPTLDVVTDDPLAAIDFTSAGAGKNRGKNRKNVVASSEGEAVAALKKKRLQLQQQIYSVNRTNPLYDDTDDRLMKKGLALPGSVPTEDFSSLATKTGETEDEDEECQDSFCPPTTGGSNSSGYGSQGRRENGVLVSSAPTTATSTLSGAANDNHVQQQQQQQQQQRQQQRQQRTSVDNIFLKNQLLEQQKRRTSGKVSSPRGGPVASRLLSRTRETPSSAHIPFVEVQRNSKYVKGIDMFAGPMPHVNMLEVARDEKYVTSIKFGYERTAKTEDVAGNVSGLKKFGGKDGGKDGGGDDHDTAVVGMRYRQIASPVGEGYAGGPDSIVTDSLLQLTSLSPNGDVVVMEADSIEEMAKQSPVKAPGPRRSEDMDRVIKELTQAVIKSRNVSTLTKAMGNKQRKRNGLRSSFKVLKRTIGKAGGGGAFAMRELWERSGMKTNGRKLLADNSSQEDNDNDNELTPSQRRRRRKRGSAKLPGRRFPRKNPSSVGSSTSSWSSSEYQVPMASNSHATKSRYYSELYAEVYDKKNSLDVLLMLSEDGGGSSSSASSGSGSNKRVTFSRDVVDHNLEAKGHKLHYERVPMASHPQSKRGDEIALDIARLNARDGFYGDKNVDNNRHYWESYYGSSGKFAGDPRASSAYGEVFASPYFDYRRTHSRAGSTQGSFNDPPDLHPRLSSQQLQLQQQRRRQQRVLDQQLKRRHRPRCCQCRLCNYCQSILTVVLFGLVLVAILVLTFVFVHKEDGNGEV